MNSLVRGTMHGRKFVTMMTGTISGFHIKNTSEDAPKPASYRQHNKKFSNLLILARKDVWLQDPIYLATG